MAIKCGVDIVEINRINDAISNERFIRRVFNDSEIEYCENKKKRRAECYSARFACKEAVSKALGTGFTNGISFTDIEVVTAEDGSPTVRLKGEALNRFNYINGKHIEVSMSHSEDNAVAIAVIEI